MGEGALAFPHEREVEKLARRFRAGRRRGFVVCIGASEGLRAKVEAALRERLGDTPLISVRIEKSAADPWSALLHERAGEARLVSARLEDKIENSALRLLDVKRELLQSEGLSLLLWVSLGEMERVASAAPNLWSYRSDVSWFLSHEDIETSAVVEMEEIPEGPTMEEELQRVEEELKWKRGQRAALLAKKAWLLQRFGRNRDALAALDEAKPLMESGSDYGEQWRIAMLDAFRVQNRIGDARNFVESGRIKSAPQRRVTERVQVALMSTEWRTACSRLEQILTNTFRWRAIDLEHHVGPTCNQITKEMLALGQLAAAERWLHEATKCVRRRAGNWWPYVVAHVEYRRANIAWERLDAITALHRDQRALRYSERSGALDAQTEALDALAERYASLGLSDDARVFRERTKKLKERLHSDPEAETPTDAEPERPVITPFVRLERAVKAAEKAVAEHRVDDASAAFAACDEAWLAEDERYRSLRLFDRWKRALARHLVARGDDAGAVDVLRDAAEQLRDLPRTRLGTLLALAQLPVGEAHTSARAAAAEEVISHAMTAGALALERDARRALAPIARARGDVEEADFHEAEAKRIAAALDEPEEAVGATPGDAIATV
ncbi:MAG: hypothetical protein U0326_19740 [Polyangiales bacterium]